MTDEQQELRRRVASAERARAYIEDPLLVAAFGLGCGAGRQKQPLMLSQGGRSAYRQTRISPLASLTSMVSWFHGWSGRRYPAMDSKGNHSVTISAPSGGRQHPACARRRDFATTQPIYQQR